METHYLTWWNLENLFDVNNSSQRPAWLQKRLAAELKGWTATVLDKKLTQLSKVINKINDDAGPDILGVCEIENKNVLDLLIKKLNRKYSVAHHDSNDGRGIDIAFLFDPKKYKQVGELFSLEIMKRDATRAIIQVQFQIIKSKKEFILLGNHWPARMPSQYDSEPFRIMAAETLSYWMERIPEKTNKEMPVIVMGDFNDEPHNRSLMDYALSCKNIEKVKNTLAQNPYLYNLMWELLGERKASYSIESEPMMLDQILVNKNLLQEKSFLSPKKNSVRIEVFDDLGNADKKGVPKRFGRPSKGIVKGDGFSDHLPVSVVIEEK